MKTIRKRGRGSGKRGLTRDQLARWAMQMAPEQLFAMLAAESPGDALRPVGEAVRLDTQAATNRWQVDGLYLRHVGAEFELWLVEMQSRAAGRRPGRTGGVLLAALRQVADLKLPEDADGRVHVVEVRTAQASRAGRKVAAEHDADGEVLEDCTPIGPVDFVATNRLLFTGPWTQVLLAHPPAWPLWAFGRQVTADEILDLVANLDPQERYAGSVAVLLREIGRVRFPEDERFREIPEKEAEQMSRALAQLERDGRINAEERKERVRQYLAQLDEQEERQVQKGIAKGLEMGRRKGREEGRMEGREALLRLVASLAPDAVSGLESITDLAELEEAARRVIAEARRSV